MPRQNRKFGDWGEKIAEEFLRKRDYEIVDKNYQKYCGEIDIVARKDGTLHFVEVKTRTIESIQRFGLPEEAVNKPKMKKIVHTALTYLSEKNCGGNINWQIDVISIAYSSRERKAKIMLIANAFDENQAPFD
jgi:putative endonuclease